MKKILITTVSVFCVIFCFAQNVGIGTTSPQAKLDINGDLIIRNANITLANGANENIDITTSKYSHYTISGPTTVFEIGGLTGGTDGRIITLYNSSAFLMVIKHLSSGSAAANKIHTGTGLDFTLSSYSSASFRYFSLDNLWHMLSSHNQFITGGGGGSNYWTAIGNDIQNNNTGNVGIGATLPSPLYKLKVKGNVYTEGPSLALNAGISGGGIEVTSSDLVNQFIRMDGKSIQSMGSPSILFNATPTPIILNPLGGNVQIGSSSNLNTKLSFPNLLGSKVSLWSNSPTAEFGLGIQPGTLQFYTAGADRMAFGWGTSSAMTETMIFYPFTGQLGIGTYNQGSYKLAVNGSIHSTEVVVETGWADYVFEPNYKLKPLSELETYIRLHKHLPNILPAKEIESNGLKLGDMQKRIMEKVEELTLYIIEQDKRIKLLEKKLTQDAQ